jgi:hypothetical protein
VEHRLIAGVQPRARKSQRRPIAFLQTENANVEVAGGIDVVGEHREVIHSVNRHGNSVNIVNVVNAATAVNPVNAFKKLTDHFFWRLLLNPFASRS